MLYWYVSTLAGCWLGTGTSGVKPGGNVYGAGLGTGLDGAGAGMELLWNAPIVTVYVSVLPPMMIDWYTTCGSIPGLGSVSSPRFVTPTPICDRIRPVTTSIATTSLHVATTTCPDTVTWLQFMPYDHVTVPLYVTANSIPPLDTIATPKSVATGGKNCMLY
jgi:hypothetical protein